MPVQTKTAAVDTPSMRALCVRKKQCVISLKGSFDSKELEKSSSGLGREGGEKRREGGREGGREGERDRKRGREREKMMTHSKRQLNHTSQQ